MCMCVFSHILVVPTLFKNGLQTYSVKFVLTCMAWMIFFFTFENTNETKCCYRFDAFDTVEFINSINRIAQNCTTKILCLVCLVQKKCEFNSHMPNTMRVYQRKEKKTEISRQNKYFVYCFIIKWYVYNQSMRSYR